ncbi:DUF3347 domain-containing protein [Pedobacter nototheniae]|uniref:DUF3347 domain-containing protein n=1 Tax=Pedobacter nototheniae TaxID=2488994 RepID=UPI00292E2085|nr:DUF3347 domain-containing protein [Pedobacter nototheniae]
MKKILILVVAMASTLVQTGFAQNDHNTHHQAPTVIASYYGLKDALVSGDASTASAKSAELTKAIESSDSKTIGDKDKSDLLKHVAMISGDKDINSQRAHFAPLSSSIITLSKSAKLSDAPIYVQYCPMKKSSWISSEKAIKNPFYGSSMLTCGKVTETIN